MAFVQRGIVYFAIVFAVGFVLGAVRVPWLVPRMGERAAELIEAPFMAIAIVMAARLTTERFPAASRGAYALSGLLALSLLLAAEIAVVLQLRGLRLSEYVEERDPVAGVVYLVLLAMFAVMPFALGRTRGPG